MSFEPSAHYTPLEWQFIVQPFDHDWPDGWSELCEDRAIWEPQLRRICDRYSLRFDDSYERAFGSHAVFLFPEFVVKFHARYSSIWYEREVEALAVLADFPDALSPRLIGCDDCDEGRSGHAYIVMQRLVGDPWKVLRDDGTDDEKLSMVRQMARATRAMHKVDPTKLKHYRADPHEWVAIMRARALLAPEYYAEDLPERFNGQLEAFLDANLDAITPDFTPHFISTDVNSFNSLFVRASRSIVMSGMIDFGDMEVGPLEYEWPSVVQKAVRHDPALARAFFESYGLELPFANDALRRLKIYSVLHRFPTVLSFAENHPDIDSFERILDMQWECVTDRASNQRPSVI